jgi:hypothetical protein
LVWNSQKALSIFDTSMKTDINIWVCALAEALPSRARLSTPHIFLRLTPERQNKVRILTRDSDGFSAQRKVALHHRLTSIFFCARLRKIAKSDY